MDEALLDLIYEAAAVPELWPAVLERLGGLVSSSTLALIAIDRDLAANFVATERYRPVLETFATRVGKYDNPRPRKALSMGHAGFLTDLELLSREELDRDPIYREVIYPAGLRYTAGTVVPVPTADMLVFDITRGAAPGPFRREEMEQLDLYRPHLARAALLSHRLGLRAAQSATLALQQVGLPAAALAASGRVLSANALLEQLAPRIGIGARDRITIAYQPAAAMLGEALQHGPGASALSIPIPATEAAPALIAHLLPIRRTARDLFNSAAYLLVLTAVVAPQAPLTEMLHGLFDLTPAEARVARGLADGLSLEEISTRADISRETVRTQLKGVMAKTATTRQAELVRLLAGASPLVETGSRT